MPLSLLATLAAYSFSADRLKVETVKALCTRLSAEAGKAIEVGSGLAGQPVFVDRRSLTVPEVLKAVAFGFHATVVPTKDGWRISRTSEDRKEMLTEVRQLWKERLTDWLAEGSQHLREASSFGDAASQVSHYQELLSEQIKRLQTEGPKTSIRITVDPNEISPLGILYSSIVRKIGVERLTATDPEQRQMWSNLPTPNQLQCPDGSALLQAFARSERVFRSKNGGAFAEPVRFTFKQVGGTGFDLCLYNADGKRLGRFGGPPAYFAMAGPILVSPANIAAPYGRDPSAWRSLDPGGLRSLPFVSSLKGPNPIAKGELPDAVTHPDKEDPLNATVRLGLEAIAEGVTGKGFVAVPTDDMLEYADGCLTEYKMNVVGFDHLLGGKWQYERKAIDGVTVLRARNPFWAEESTVDRYNLAAQTKALLAVSKISGTDLAIANFRLYPQDSSRAASRIFAGILRSQPHYRSNALNMGGQELAWIGAALLATQGARGPVQIDAQNEPFKSLINRGVNSGWLRFESATKMSDEKLDPAAIVGSTSFTPRLVLEVAGTPTISPLGVNADPKQDPESTMYQPIDQVGDMYGAFATGLPKELYDAHPELLPSREEMLKRIRTWGKYHLGSHDVLTVTLYPFNGVRSRLPLEEWRVKQTNLAFDELPEGMRKSLIDLAMAHIQQFMAGKVGQPVTPTLPATGGKSIPPLP